MRTLLVLIALTLAFPAFAADVRVIDGDGLIIDGQSFRLWGIDAPELKQECQLHGEPYPCGQVAKATLTALIDGQDVQCENLYLDRYKRSIARCYVNSMDLGSELVRLGLAIDWPKYSDGHYARQQEEAKVNQRGLWGGDFQAPSVWRKR